MYNVLQPCIWCLEGILDDMETCFWSAKWKKQNKAVCKRSPLLTGCRSNDRKEIGQWLTLAASRERCVHTYFLASVSPSMLPSRQNGGKERTVYNTLQTRQQPVRNDFSKNFRNCETLLPGPLELGLRKDWFPWLGSLWVPWDQVQGGEKVSTSTLCLDWTLLCRGNAT